MLPPKTAEISSTSSSKCLTLYVKNLSCFLVSFKSKKERNNIHTDNFSLLLYQNMEGHKRVLYPCTMITVTKCRCFVSQCNQKQVTNTTINGMIYQLSPEPSKLKFIRIMTCLGPLNTTKCSQVCNYWQTVVCGLCDSQQLMQTH